jgi:hypothetical protein
MMPEGSKLFLYNDSHAQIIGAFTSRNNKPDGRFATGLLRGETITLEYYEPERVSAPGRIRIGYIVHGYKDIFKDFPLLEKDYGNSGPCEVNVNCTQGAAWQNEKRAVAMILTSNGSRICSGIMINNVRQDLAPYFLTANHCIEGDTPGTWIFMFNYESPGCANIDGPLNYTLTGSTALAYDDTSDFALLRLNETPPDSFKLHWAGWNAGTATPSSGACIHHPSGDIKKISLVTSSFIDSSWTDTPTHSHWRVFWSTGVTEPGSSGAAIFDQNHHIVGQLHGGPSACSGDDKSDMFGKFSWSWNYGSTPATRLKDWLDPDNTGLLTLDGWDKTLGVRDYVPPTKITDLHLLVNASASVTLAWTAPTDSSHGGVTRYEIRYATSAITDTNSFKNATLFSYTGAPKSAGQAEQISISGLAAATIYFFAIRSYDMWNNGSELSNVVKDTTWQAPSLSVTPAALTDSLFAGSMKSDTVLLRNMVKAPSTLNYAISFENNTFPSGVIGKLLIPLAGLPEKKNEELKSLSVSDPGQSISAHGGPDQFGYQWVDSDDSTGPKYTWDDISATGTPLSNWTATGSFAATDEGYSGPVPIGFTFPFYGQTKTQVYVAADGVLLFSAPTKSLFTNPAIPDTTSPNEFIAPFWDDLDGSAQGTVYYKTDGNRFIVQYTNWQRYSKTGSLTFQVILFASGKIMFCYNNMNATLNSATVGIENAGGTVGLQIAYDAPYIKNNLVVQIVPRPDWYSGSNLSGTIGNNNSTAVVLSFHGQNIPAGDYSVDMKISSNDPIKPLVIVPVKLKVKAPLIPITVVSPNGKENWKAGSAQQITWTTNGVDSVKLAYSTDAGKSWMAITDSAITGNSYSWKIPNTPSTACFVRISNASADSIFDTSDSAFSISKPDLVRPYVPLQFSIGQNYPNPFNPATTITYSIPTRGHVSLRVYDALGREVATLVNEEKAAGNYSLTFAGGKLASGMYFYTIRAGSFVATKKMLLVK